MLAQQHTVDSNRNLSELYAIAQSMTDAEKMNCVAFLAAVLDIDNKDNHPDEFVNNVLPDPLGVNCTTFQFEVIGRYPNPGEFRQKECKLLMALLLH